MAWNTFTREELSEICRNSGYELISSYVDEKSKKTKLIVCDSYGYKYNLFLSKIGKPASIVHVGNEFSIFNIPIWLKINNRPFELFGNNEYTGTFDRNLILHCFNCDDNFVSSWSLISQFGGCAKCDGKQVGKYNNLGYKCPELIKDFSQKNDFSPYEIAYGSTRNIIWECFDCGHEWITKVMERSVLGHGCPACCSFPKVVTDKNRFSILFPEIASEWHPTKNGDLTPDDVSYGSNKNVWWICPVCGDEYQSWIGNRVLDGRGCQKCNLSNGESFVERILLKYGIKRIFQKRFDNCRNKRKLPFDFYLPDYNLCIEYHGIQHYESIEFFGGNKRFEKRVFLDKIKENYCYDNGINLLVIPYWEFNNIEEILVNTLSEIERSSE